MAEAQEIDRYMKDARERLEREKVLTELEKSRKRDRDLKVARTFSAARAFITWSETNGIAGTDVIRGVLAETEVPKSYLGGLITARTQEPTVKEEHTGDRWVIWTGEPVDYEYEHGHSHHSGKANPDKSICRDAKTGTITLSKTVIESFGPEVYSFNESGEYGTTSGTLYIANYRKFDQWENIVSLDDINRGVAELAVRHRVDPNGYLQLME